MGSLVPGWDEEAPGRNVQKQVPEWLERVRSSQGDSKMHVRSSLSPRASQSSDTSHFATQSSLRRASTIGHTVRVEASSHAMSTSPVAETPSPRVSSARMRLARTSWPVNYELANEPSEESPISDKIKWWQRVDSSVYNNPRTDKPEDYRSGTYVAQHDVALQHKHRDDVKQGGQGVQDEDLEEALDVVAEESGASVKSKGGSSK